MLIDNACAMFSNVRLVRRPTIRYNRRKRDKLEKKKKSIFLIDQENVIYEQKPYNRLPCTRK